MQTACQIDGCDSPIFVKTRGWCKKHYHRWYRTGDPTAAAYDRLDGPNRWRRCYSVSDSGCWDWVKGLDRAGYGQYSETIEGARKNHRAHRYVYEQVVGPILDGLSLDHLCRNRRCVNPEHLEPVSHAENVARGESGAHNKAKTHCAQGHEFSDANTEVSKRGWRVCKTCARERGAVASRKYRERHKQN